MDIRQAGIWRWREQAPRETIRGMENEQPTPHAPGVTIEHASRRTSLVAATAGRQRSLQEVETAIVMLWVAGELHIRCAAWGLR